MVVASINLAPISVSAYMASNVPSYLFDATYYAIKYYDLYQAFGTDKQSLYNHWLTYGKKEERSPSPVYDADYYLNNNSNLKAAFGNDYSALYDHFVTCGINEFRKSSPIYDGNYYKTHYSDLQYAFGSNSVSYLEHFMSYGMNEGRQGSNEFNATDYKNRYYDLQNAFGSNMTSYYYHYMEYGVDEGRDASPSGSNSPLYVGDITGTGKTAWVATSGSSLNMRTSASTSSSIVIKIPNGSQITVYGNATNGFYKAAYGSASGYVSSSYVTFSQPTNTTSSNSSSGLVNANLSKVSLIKQGSKTCKATAVAQSLNLIVGSNKYTTSGMGGSNCKSINGNTYKGSDGNTYVATYKTDTYKGSASEQLSKINEALAAGLPIVVAVRKTTSGTNHHWVTIIGKSGSTYEIIDPATGTRRTMSAALYTFGMVTSGVSGYCYGYVSFTRK